MISNFQKIIDTISDALSFFDFSFIVSGSMTYGAICYYLWRTKWLTIPDETWFAVITSVILIYICGLMSFILGKKIRLWILRKFNKDVFKSCYDNAVMAMQKAEILKGIDYEEMSEEQSKLKYTIMWGALRECKECEKTIAFLNRFWVMQAVCEGLLFSSLVIIAGGVMAFIYYLCYEGWDWDLFFQYILCVIAGGLGMFAFYKEGKRYAENQINEVVSAYYRNILP